MTDLTELDGVAEGRAENLTEAGYESVEDLVDADPEVIADEVNYLPEDTALELVVQAQNMVEEDEGEETIEEDEDNPVDGDSITEDVEEAVEEDETETVAEDQPAEIDGPDLDGEDVDAEDEEAIEEADGQIVFELEFSSGLEYETFFDAMMRQRAKVYRQNKSGVEAFDHGLEQMRKGSDEEPVELSLEEQQLNDLHNSVRQMSIEYKGDNLIDHMDALDAVYNQIENVRSEYLF